MEQSIVIIEPDLCERRRYMRALISSSFDAIPIPAEVASSDLYALRALCADAPNAIVLSDRLTLVCLKRLSQLAREMGNIVVIGFGHDIPLALVSHRVPRSVPKLLTLLHNLFDPKLLN